MRDGGENVTIGSIRLIAEAFGDALENALIAAADLRPHAPEDDPEMEAILSAPVDNTTKRKMIERLYELREEDERRRSRDIQWMIDRAKGA